MTTRAVAIMASVRAAASELRQGGAADENPRTRRRVWWVAFAVFSLVIGIWSLSMPLFSSPDEPAHVTKAAAVVRGQFLGRDVNTPKGIVTHVKVPEALTLDTVLPCYARQVEVTAKCLHLRHGSKEVDSGTQAGHYPPEYYIIVGAPSLIAPNHIGLWLMRLASVLLSGALLASALLSVRRRSPVLGPLGLAVAVTPMVLFMSAGVNPSGLEITAGIATWATLLAFLDDPDGADRRLVVRLGCTASMLALSRSLAPLWLAIAVVVAVMWAGIAPVRAALTRRDVKICTAVVVLTTGVATAWIKFAGALDLRSGSHKYAHISYAGALLHSFQHQRHRIEQYVGIFGWLDTRSPAWSLIVWIVAAGLLVVLGLATARRREAVALVGLICAVVAVPILIEASQAHLVGFIWQGRYTMPIVVGIPLLAVRTIERERVRLSDVLLRRIALVSLWLLMSAHLTAFLWNLKRNVAGITKTWLPIKVLWHPPVPLPLLLAGVVVAFALLGWLLYGSVPRQADPDEYATRGTRRQGGVGRHPTSPGRAGQLVSGWRGVNTQRR